MNPPRLYLCGPMTGQPDYNYPAFARAAAALRAAGMSVFNPAENGLPAHAEWEQHMRRDLVALTGCYAVATLPGTAHSRGAQLELHVAKALGMPVASHLEWLEAAYTTFSTPPEPTP